MRAELEILVVRHVGTFSTRANGTSAWGRSAANQALIRELKLLFVQAMGRMVVYHCVLGESSYRFAQPVLVQPRRHGLIGKTLEKLVLEKACKVCRRGSCGVSVASSVVLRMRDLADGFLAAHSLHKLCSESSTPCNASSFSLHHRVGLAWSAENAGLQGAKLHGRLSRLARTAAI